jgi:hypothetical protein
MLWTSGKMQLGKKVPRPHRATAQWEDFCQPSEIKSANQIWTSEAAKRRFKEGNVHQGPRTYFADRKISRRSSTHRRSCKFSRHGLSRSHAHRTSPSCKLVKLILCHPKSVTTLILSSSQCLKVTEPKSARRPINPATRSHFEPTVLQIYNIHRRRTRLVEITIVLS